VAEIAVQVDFDAPNAEQAQPESPVNVQPSLDANPAEEDIQLPIADIVEQQPAGQEAHRQEQNQVAAPHQEQKKADKLL
jgi:hypothetical protein